MRKNLLIVHGNSMEAKKAKEIALEVNSDMEVYEADTIGKAYELLINVTMDIFIIDVVIDSRKMGDVSGIHLAKRIREINKYVLTPIIFITTEKDPQMYAFRELNCLAYLHRPYMKENLKTAIEKALHYRTERTGEESIFFRSKGIISTYKVKDIVYIENAARIMYIHMVNGKTEQVSYKPYAVILREADSECLFRCNRGIVVNKNYILGIDFPNRQIILKNGWGMVDIGGTFRKKILLEFGYKKDLPDIEF